MSKFLAYQNQKFANFLFYIIYISLIVFIFACGDADYSSSGTGSIAFSIEWRDAPTIKNTEAFIKTILSCEDVGIETIKADVFDESDSFLVSGGPWLCSAHQGTVYNILVGSNRKFIVLGKDINENVIYRGEQSGISISAGQETNVGTIVVEPITTTAPSAPTNVIATVGNGRVTICWDSVSRATSYNIYWSTSAGVTISTGTKISDVTSSYTHASLTNDTTYYYVVTAVNSYGESSESSEVSAIPSATGTAPSAPTNVIATAGDGQVTISWDSVSGATSYNIYWSTSSGVTTDTGTKISDVTSSYTHASLTNDTTYYYVVTATNDYGESAESDEVNATPQVGANTSPQLSSGYVSPESGTTIDNTFTFYVDYYDADGDPPATRYVYIDDTAYTMEFYSGSLSNGTYRYEATLGNGSHAFYFEFADGNGGTSRLPTAGSYSGPEIETVVVTVTGKILYSGQPVTNFKMLICYYSPDWNIADESYTDSEGIFSFSITPIFEFTDRYSVQGYVGQTDPSDTFDWWLISLTFESDQLVLPDFDMYYDDLFSPPDGATYNANDINDSNPIVFEWTNGGRNDIAYYRFQINPGEPIVNRDTDSTTISFNGILDDGTKIEPGTYDWRLEVHFGEAWLEHWFACSGDGDKAFIIE